MLIKIKEYDDRFTRKCIKKYSVSNGCSAPRTPEYGHVGHHAMHSTTCSCPLSSVLHSFVEASQTTTDGLVAGAPGGGGGGREERVTGEGYESG